jgi:hypothetical protein
MNILSVNSLKKFTNKIYDETQIHEKNIAGDIFPSAMIVDISHQLMLS